MSYTSRQKRSTSSIEPLGRGVAARAKKVQKTSNKPAVNEGSDEKEDFVQNALKEMMRKCSKAPFSTMTSWDAKMNPLIAYVCSRHTNVNKSTLRRRWKAYLGTGSLEQGKRGPKFLLTNFEEKKLLEWIECRRLLILTPTEVEIRGKACDILSCRGATDPFVGTKWFRDFVARHPVEDLIQRSARTREQARVGLKEEQVARWFVRLEADEGKRPTDVVSISTSCFAPNYSVLENLNMIWFVCFVVV